jgi:hypothetical protein
MKFSTGSKGTSKLPAIVAENLLRQRANLLISINFNQERGVAYPRVVIVAAGLISFAAG